jgi:hypothetical protein
MEKDIYNIFYRLQIFRSRLWQMEFLYGEGMIGVEQMDMYRSEIEDMEAEILVYNLMQDIAIHCLVMPVTKNNKQILNEDLKKNEQVISCKVVFNWKILWFEWHVHYINKSGVCYF